MIDRFMFRVWNPLKGCWLHSYKQSGGCSIVGEIILLGSWLSEVRLEDYNQLIFEQCTGLKDKTGGLAFDADIIENKKYGGKAVIRWGVPGESYCGWCVEWVPENMNKGQMKHDLLYYSNFENCEIIGNIHENPELMR